VLGPSRRLTQAWHAAVLAVAAIVLGTVGFLLIEDVGFVEALYQTVITVTTVGALSEPETVGGRLFTAVVALAGVAIFLHIFGLVIELTVSGVLGGALQERRVRRRVHELEGHYVICGYGRMGRSIASELKSANAAYVVIDEDPAEVTYALAEGHVAIAGSATDDQVLAAAGIDRAAGLVACAGSDAENLYIVVNAHDLRPDLFIVARASTEDAARNLRRGGAHRTVSPYTIAGREVATMILKPQVAAFLDAFTDASLPTFRLEQIEVGRTCAQVGASLGELCAREGARVIAHRRRHGEFDARLDPALRIEEGDVLIGVGTAEQVAELERLFAARGAGG
jgi:voltage-gated potassium channel